MALAFVETGQFVLTFFFFFMPPHLPAFAFNALYIHTIWENQWLVASEGTEVKATK